MSGSLHYYNMVGRGGLKIIISFQLFYYWAAPNPTCATVPNGYYQYHNKWYKMVTTSATYALGLSACESSGAYPAQIKSLADYQAVMLMKGQWMVKQYVRILVSFKCNFNCRVFLQ